ncbi:hypothetical protein IWW38_005773, partial [Coemansia aciculifera]
MSSHLSPAAQFAAAAAAEAKAAAEARALNESSVDASSVPPPFLAVCPPAPPGYVAPEFMAGDGPPMNEPFLCICPPAPPGHVAPDFSQGITAVDVVVSENAVGAADSAVGSDDGHSNNNAASVIDLADEDLFPALGQPKPASSQAGKAAAWGGGGVAALAKAKPQGPKRATEVVDLPMMQEAVGAAVLKIMERSGARIDVSHNRVLQTSTYVISGSADAVSKAKREVVSKLSPRVTKVVAVPAEARSAVVGVRGRGLQAIQAKTGAALSASSEGFDAGDAFATAEISVTGDSAAVAAAVALVEAAADTKTTRRVAGVVVARDAHALLVGKGGAGLRALQAAHPGVALRIPGPLDAAGQAIGVAGERSAVAAASAAIRDT